MKIRLETRDGEFVADRFVPPFLTLPEVVTWGVRHFAHYGAAGSLIYREVFAYTIVEPYTEELRDNFGKPAERYFYKPINFSPEALERIREPLPETATGNMIKEANKRPGAKLSDAVHPLPSYPLDAPDYES